MAVIGRSQAATITEASIEARMRQEVLFKVQLGPVLMGPDLTAPQLRQSQLQEGIHRLLILPQLRPAHVQPMKEKEQRTSHNCRLL